MGYSEISGPHRLPKNSSWHEPAAAPVGIPSSHTPTTISFSMQQCEIYFRTDANVSVRTLGIESFPFVAPRPPLLFSRQLAKNAPTTTAATSPPFKPLIFAWEDAAASGGPKNHPPPFEAPLFGQPPPSPSLQLQEDTGATGGGLICQQEANGPSSFLGGSRWVGGGCRCCLDSGEKGILVCSANKSGSSDTIVFHSFCAAKLNRVFTEKE